MPKVAKKAPNPNSAFMKPKTLSPELEAVVGKGPMPAPEVMKKVWEYIKGDDYVDDNGKKGSSLRKGATLQNAKDKRVIDADEKLKKVFGGESSVNMMKMAGFIFKNFS